MLLLMGKVREHHITQRQQSHLAVAMSLAAAARWNLELWVRVALWHAADGAEPLQAARCA